MEIKYEKFKVIYADCPWSYKDTQNGNGRGDEFLSASKRYDLMTNKDIGLLDVKSVAHKDCALFLWATSPLLPEAMETIKSWGFKFKTIAFVWSKESVHGKKIANMGRWTMGNVEICLLAVRGKIKRQTNNVRQLIEAVRTTHSSKPEEVAERIELLMGNVPMLEMFARRNRPGWVCLGNGLDGVDIGESLKSIKEQFAESGFYTHKIKEDNE